MPKYFGVVTVVLLIGFVITRVQIMKRKGTQAMHFGKIDKTDFLIPPFALFYFYTIFAGVFDLPNINTTKLFESKLIPWAGVLFCSAGLVMLVWSLVSFGQSFRIGIDAEQPDELVTTGIFALSRNPIYVAFAFTLLGQFLIYPNPILLIYLGAAVWLFHRQVLREEEFLLKYYGEEFREYSNQVRRYL